MSFEARYAYNLSFCECYENNFKNNNNLLISDKQNLKKIVHFHAFCLDL